MGLFSRKEGKQKSGFMSSVMDEVHGGHLSGSNLALWPEIRDAEVPMVEASADTVITDKGRFLILFQPSRVLGAPDGPLQVSAEPIDRELAMAICSKRETTGYLSVYTPCRGDAESLMFDATGEIPVEHASCMNFLQACMGSIRGPSGSEGMPGPMCCFGAFHLLDDDPEVRTRTDDELIGFHAADEHTIVLAPDLGGAALRIDEGVLPGDCEDGRFYAIIVPDDEHPDLGCVIVPEPIDRGLALRICGSWIRSGVLSVFTPLRSDAQALADEASEGSAKHAKPRSPADLPCFRPKPYGQDPGALVYYRD
ncbi:MAG: hypothetical protein Q4Q58_03095 [Thermoplasmata archaeon]|nr:hypothetical protein [Thermoplasmata archaeon]